MMGFCQGGVLCILSLVFRVRIALDFGESSFFSLDPPYCIFRFVLVNFLPLLFLEILSKRGVVHYGVSPLLRRRHHEMSQKKPSMATRYISARLPALFNEGTAHTFQ